MGKPCLKKAKSEKEFKNKRYVKMKKCSKNIVKAGAVASLLIIQILQVKAQDGNAGIQQANTQVRGYFESGTNLMYAIGAIVGLIGAVKVYQKWNSGDQDTSKVAAAWFGSCIFLVVVATIIKSFFGI
ncbi:hypothetical protein HDC91_002727 [Mucilaginibacter sp. AK015]|nr:hypothetical protein [Mucilaginibacter sp. AK015]